MAEEFKLQIGTRGFIVEEPTFEKLEALKKALGFEITTGMSAEQQSALLSDMNQVAKVVAILVTEVVIDGEAPPFCEGTISELQNYIYKHGKVSDLKKALNFFGKALQGESGNGSATNPSEAPTGFSTGRIKTSTTKK